jgi:hypothetical protein
MFARREGPFRFRSQALTAALVWSAVAATAVAQTETSSSDPKANPGPSPGAGAAADAKPKPPAPRPTVVSKAKQKEQGRASAFLRPPGSSRYDQDAIDWREVPPWRQASYFGIKAQGQFFVYVVDCSGSTIVEDRLARAKEELRRSVAALQPPQKFLVIFYNDEPIPMPGGLPRSAGLTSRDQLLAWLRIIEPDGGTDPRGAMGTALSLRPDAVFLLSDGEFPEGTVEAIARKNTRRTPIHCIDLSGGAAGDQLERIARDSGGRYAPRPWVGP